MKCIAQGHSTVPHDPSISSRALYNLHSISEGFVFLDYLEVATTVVVPRGVGKISPRTDIFSYSGHSGMLGFDGKQNAT